MNARVNTRVVVLCVPMTGPEHPDASWPQPVKVERSETKRRRNTFAVPAVLATLDSVVEHRKTAVID